MNRGRNKTIMHMLLNVSQFVCVFCLSSSACLTSGAAFLFCSLMQRVSRLRLASKHSGHTLLVLLSKVFEHFAQMACRRTQKEKETALSHLSERNCPLVP